MLTDRSCHFTQNGFWKTPLRGRHFIHQILKVNVALLHKELNVAFPDIDTELLDNRYQYSTGAELEGEGTCVMHEVGVFELQA